MGFKFYSPSQKYSGLDPGMNGKANRAIARQSKGGLGSGGIPL